MEFRLLQCVVTVADELSFTQAAKKLYIAQPALSKQIRELEASLGVRLFERNTRQVNLTEAGRAFVDEARAAIEHSQRAGHIAQAVSRGDGEPVAVGYSPHFNFELLDLVRRRSTSHFGNDGITFTSAFTIEQVQHVLSGHLDVGLGIFPVDDSILETFVLLEDPVGVVVAKNHPLSKRTNGTIRLSDLKNESVILLPAKLHPELHGEISKLWAAIGYKPHVTQQVHAISEAVALVASGVGISFTKFSSRSVMPPTVTMLSLPAEERPLIRMGAFTRKSHRSSKIDKFLKMLRGMKQNSAKAQSAR